MNMKQTAAVLVLAASALATGNTFAAGLTNAEHYPFAEVTSMKMMDKNKDGMISRKEFIDMMGMAWDMNAKKMGATTMMNPEQYRQFLDYLKAGA
ncbi:MAG: hypothetical protein HY854_13105 [Burkholderiales bacterium]|nr:hypothetical protein [Burkholderiales bacterium]